MSVAVVRGTAGGRCKTVIRGKEVTAVMQQLAGPNESGFDSNGEFYSSNAVERKTAALLPLTPAQRGMWFADSLSPDYSVNTAQYVDIKHAPGELDIELLMDCNYVVGRELETPYIRLIEIDGVPMQYVDLDYDQKIDLVDFRDRENPLAEAMAWMQNEYRRPVDLIDDQLIVVAIIRVADNHTVWYQRAHHIIIDGFAALTTTRRILDRYNSLKGGDQAPPRPALSLSGIVEYEAEYAESSRREADRQYWLERTRDLPERVTLARSSVLAPLTFENLVAGESLDPGLQRRIEELAQRVSGSPAVILMAGFAAFLARMTGNDDIVLSLPVTGRAAAKIKHSGGMVSNVLPVRIGGVRELVAGELISAVQLELIGALRHQRYRTEDIRRDAGMDADSVGFGPTINMVFFDSPVVMVDADLDYRILSSGILEDLLINLYQSGPEAPLVVDLHGNPHLYSQYELALHHRRFIGFLDRFVGDLAQPIAEIDLLLPGEAAEIDECEGDLSAERVGVAGDEHLLDRFVAQAAATPDASALIVGSRTVTYREFAARVAALGRQLIDHGVGPEVCVALSTPRSVEMMVAMYAVVAAGGQYLPIDTEIPADRVAYMFATAHVQLLLVSQHESEVDATAAAASVGVPVRRVDAAGAVDLSTPSVAAAERGGITADSAAYTLFTSGSTGMPKGVVLSHGAVLNRLYWGLDELGPNSGDRVVQKTPYTFDCSVPELFAPLMVGATLILLKDGGHLDPQYVASEIARSRATMVHFVPSMLSLFLEVNDWAALSELDSVRVVSATGEALPPALAAAVRRIWPTIEFYNLYGPTEAAIEITYERIAAVDGTESSVPIGLPVSNATARVLDSRLLRVPAGVPGELYLGGTQLARGYVGRADLSAERFVADPFSVSGSRMYRTGDLVRRLPDGRLEYLGRTDFQVKLRGQRIELGEIEAVIAGAPGVVHAAVTVVAGPGGAEHLVAYLAGAGEAIDLDEVRAAADRALPSYMVPNVWTVLDEIALNSAGKLDRKSLPAPDFRTPDREYVEPRSPIELRLAGILEEMLGTENIGVGDNIFDLGADSLAAARLRARLRSEGIDLALTDIFSSRTIADMARAAEPLREVPLALGARERPERIPLSYPQGRLWFINRIDPAAPTYNMPGAVRVRTSVDSEALRSAIIDVMDRHEALRTIFPIIDRDPVQQVLSVDEAAELVSLRTLSVTAASLESGIIGEASAGFDLVADLPVRFALVRATDRDVEDSVLVVVLHHIAGDGYSMRPLIADLITAYEARSRGRSPEWAALPVQYVDFALWQREILGDRADPGSRIALELDFWRRELAGAPELLALPTDNARPATPTGSGGFVDVTLDRDTVARIKELARTYAVTPFTVLHVALSTVLGRLAGVEDVSLGTPVAGRDEPETTGLIGMFVNTVVLRTVTSAGTTVADALVAAGAARARALEHSQVPFETVVDAVAGPRTMAHTPLFQVSLTLVDDYRGALEELGAELYDSRVPVAKYDLAVGGIEIPEGASRCPGAIELEFNYSADLFTPASMQRLAEQFTAVLHQMLDDPARVLGSIDILPVDEIAELTRPPLAVPPGTLRELLHAGAAGADPSTPAVVGTGVLSRAEFADRSARLARMLLDRGIGPGDVVALAIPRSHLSVLATAAVVETGAAFVSIDVRNPVERRQLMLDDSGAKVGLASLESADVAESHDNLDWLILGDPGDEALIGAYEGRPVMDDELRRSVQLDDVAYLIYTSGSTGTPKAVAVPNRALAGLVAGEAEHLAVTSASRVLHVSSPTFDASILELTMAWCFGATVVVADLHTYAGTDLSDLIDLHGVTHLFLTPSVLATIEPESVPTLQHVLGGGEANPPELVRRWVTAGRRYVNIYGPTETTVWTTVDVYMETHDEVGIGRGLPGVGTLVLDSGLRPVPVGVPGELYLAGDQVTLGYHGMPGLTSTRFVANPFADGRRMYRTGDRVQRRSNGSLGYLGRADHQLKIRGLRIEPGEVDEAMMAHAGVSNALTVSAFGAGGEPVLATYVMPAGGADISVEELLDHARRTLPGHMVPQAVQLVDEFPRNLTGKIDRQQLPGFSFASDREYVAPRTAREAEIAEVFAQHLGVDRVGVQAGFFELGGNSLAAVKLATALSGVTGHQVPVKTLLEASSVEAIAAYVETAALGRDELPLRPRSRPEVVPLSEVQRGMWLLNRTDPESPAYNIAFALRLSGRLDVDAVRAAAADLVERQAALRTCYPMVDGDPSQRIVPVDESVAALDLDVIDAGSDTLDLVHGIVRRGFDVTASPPFRMALLRTGETEHIVVFVIHHISADGSSLRPLARDFIAAALAHSGAAEPALPPLRVDYTDFSLWQADRLRMMGADGLTERERQLTYWSDRLRGAPDQLRLPADRPRPATPSFTGDTVEFKVPAALVNRLDLIARRHDATLFDVFHAAYAVLLGRLAGVDDVVIGTAFAGRVEPALDDLVGMFVNSLPLRTTLDRNEAFGDLVARVHAEDLEDMSNADVAFESIVETVGIRRSSSVNPLFQAMLLFQNFEMPVVEVPGLTITPMDEGLVAGQVDLQLSVFPTDPLQLGGGAVNGPMRANFVYATDLFESTTVERYAERFLTVLEAVASDPSVSTADISIAAANDTLDSPGDDDAPVVALPDLVEARATEDPLRAAVIRGGATITFGELWTMTVAMAGAISDRDSALVTALVTLMPDLAAAGPEALGDALAEIRSANH